ncbi:MULTISPECIES: class I SAM-dependent methyltransferase [unclassified Treponema]|uniref:class I SAM-dependent methyltransferase n=1 Tax=unclassified Treponema TaxID=2638727 RepID=UPI0020A49646|nr:MULTISPECIES: class I SAM-dependent methyltransferase [unclassified Treponema]UTC65901.1 class I SAM-dependent methyltransferase [Treponema sp. OMZ 789]UTC68629.1 class I SAM-dependent methyltransferase [Treponema sp. OMZ 790]UTC71359.1 class I SAM-dependent methyltransferase [Treponema sp. OMZ 791]
MQKIHIEKNSVQETLIVPLYGRKMCAEKFPDLYTDKSAKLLCEKLDYDFSEQEAKKDSLLYEFGALEAAMRQLDLMYEIKDYLKNYPKASVVNLGCGLDQTGRACDNGKCRIFNVDLPKVMSIRSELVPARERETNISCDLKNYSWMDKIDGSEGVILFAAGVFHYFKREDVKTLILELAKRYPRGVLVFDTVGKFGLKMMLSQTLKNMGISDVSAFFSINNPAQQLNWSDKIRVSYKGYMLGYYDMKNPGIRGIHRFLARIGDGFMKMRIIRMDFLE